MAQECKAFYKRMAEMNAEKRNISVTIATNVIQTRINFLLVRSTLRCIRESRSKVNNNLDDFNLANQAQIRQRD